MHFFASLVAISSVATLASGYEFPSFVPVAKRQTSGPAYECHANCGYAIQNSAVSGYCDDPKWKGLLDGCLDCALKYDIWKYYGTKVGAAAKACGLDATPKAAEGSGSSSASSSAAPATSSDAPASTSSAGVSTSAPATEHPTQSTQKPTEKPTEKTTGSSTAVQTESSSAAHTTPHSSAPAASGSGSGNATSTHTVPTAGAATVQQTVMLAIGAVAAFALNMM